MPNCLRAIDGFVELAWIPHDVGRLKKSIEQNTRKKARAMKRFGKEGKRGGLHM
jgi:hypothetical protein